MAYGRDSYGFQTKMSATFIPGLGDDYNAPPVPTLVAPEPQRINPEMSNQIAGGMNAVNNLDLNSQGQRNSSYSKPLPNDEPSFSPFPKLVNPPPNVPPSDIELEATLESARTVVLSSNDPEMQLAWAADALVYVGVCADNEERVAAVRPLAARPSTPRIEHTLKVDAMNITNFLADQHHPKAEFLKGMWLEWGRFGQREDKKEAFRCYSRAADRGYARAEYRIGMLYESYNDPIKALRHYYKGIEAGDAASCYRLGMMTLRGQHGQQQDFAKAIDLIKRSANAADENAAQGAYVYGMLLARQLPQIDVPDGFLAYDEQQARMNIEKAAYLKFAKAQLKMGSCYELAGLGCEFNPALSMHYNALASKQGEPEADMALSKWFLVGTEGIFAKNEELAYSYAERAAQSGLATAEFALGYFNEIGVHVRVDLDKAMEWYQRASKHGNADAAARIEGLSKRQTLSRKDHEQVAVSRIKSQHGSMRGGRPERLRTQQPQHMGQIPESPAVPNYANGTVPHSAPVRGRTPYPEDNGPPIIPPLNSRPVTVTPYPIEDGPPKQFQSAVGSYPPRPATTLNPDVRPSSAFQFNPDFRPNSVGTQPPPSQAPYPGGQPQYGPGGPGSRLPPAGSVAPQVSDPSARRPLPSGNRIPTSQANMQAYSPGPIGPAQQPQQLPFRPAGQQPPIPPAPQQFADPQQQPQQRLDIGFSAPPDNRRRQYGPTPPTSSAPTSSSTRPVQTQPGPRPQPPSQSSNPIPPPTSSKPASSRPAQVPSQKPLPSQPVSKPVSSAATKPLASSGAQSAGKPGKPPRGPKTFDEMGVPSGKKDGDCVIM